MFEHQSAPKAPGRRARPFVIATIAILAGVFLAVAACNQAATKTQGSAPSRLEEEYDGPPMFDDVTAATGVSFTYRNGEEAGHFAIIESLGGGVALFDFDRDGLLDIFVPGGGFYQEKKVLGHPSKLFRNLGAFKFEDVSAKIGLDKITFQYSHGAAAYDYDCDGWLDLVVTGYNRLVLLRNEADGAGGRRFVEVTKAAKLDDKLWSTSAAWGDLDGDGYPDLYVAHYGNWGFETNHPTDCTYDGKTRDVCQPRMFKALPHSLYRNNRDGTFTDVSNELKPRENGKGIGVLFVDVDNDCRPDIYVANDTDDNFLYLNRGRPGQLALEELGLLSGVARDDRGMANGSMGVDGSDYHRSGRASLFVSNYENELPALYRNNTTGRAPQFIYDTLASGIATIGGSYVSWGTGFFDYDLDGWDDIAIVSGHAIRFPTKIDRRQKPMLLHNDGGKFKSTAIQGGRYFRDPHNARGLAFGDLDNDGRIDLVVSHLNEPVAILRNVAPVENRQWVGIELQGDKHADLVGARVVVESDGGVQTKFVRGGGSYASTNDPRLVFGLKDATKVKRVTIHWPSGKSRTITEIQPESYWRIPEGDGPAVKVEGKKP